MVYTSVSIPSSHPCPCVCQETDNRELQQFYTKMKTFSLADSDIFADDLGQKSKVLSEKYASFTGTLGLYEAWAAAHCDVYRLPEVYMTFPVGVFLQKGSPYSDNMSKQ